MSIGVWQVVLILLVVLIIFGAGKLPRVMGDVAKGVKNFKQGMKEDEDPASQRQIPSDDADVGTTTTTTSQTKDETAKS